MQQKGDGKDKNASSTANQIADQVVAYRILDSAAREEQLYGLCIRKEGDIVRVVGLQIVEQNDKLLQLLATKSTEEVSLIATLNRRLEILEEKISEQLSDHTRSKSYRLQDALLQWALQRVEGIQSNEWEVLARQESPSPILHAVGRAFAAIVSQKAFSSSPWELAQSTFSKGQDSVNILRRLRHDPMPRDVYDSIDSECLSEICSSYTAAVKECLTLGAIHKCVTALMDYQRARFMENCETELQQQITVCQSSIHTAEERLHHLRNQINLVQNGRCYSRMQTVRSVPLSDVLFVVASEKITTRQYLLNGKAEASHNQKLLDESICKRGRLIGARNIERDTKTQESSPSSAPHSMSQNLVNRQISVRDSSRTHSSNSCSTSSYVMVGNALGSHAVNSLHVAQSSSTSGSTNSGIARDDSGQLADFPTRNLPTVEGCIENAPHTSVSSFAVASQARNTPSHPPVTPFLPQILEKSALATIKQSFDIVHEALAEYISDSNSMEERYTDLMHYSRKLLEVIKEKEDEADELRSYISATHQRLLLSTALIALLRNERVLNGTEENLKSEIYIGSGTSKVSNNDHLVLKSLLNETLDFIRGAAAASMFDI